MGSGMMTAYIFGAFLAAAATPLPVHVENWPGADKVALDTLKYAQWAFWATVAAAVVAVVGTGFAFVDYLLNIRQFRKPKLRVSLWEDYKRLNFGGFPIPGNSKALTFPPELQLLNEGKRSTSGCFVSIWIPRPLKLSETSLIEWKTFTIGEGFRDKPGLTYDRIETYIKEPVFTEHPIILPVFSVVSPEGETEDVDMRWQVFSETGKSPSDLPGYLHCGVKIMTT
jgi:hypothetical protein